MSSPPWRYALSCCWCCLPQRRVLSLQPPRPKPLLIAALTAALVATTVAPHPVLLGVGVGFGAFAVLIALFFTISTVLHARQRRSRHARPG